MEGPKREIYATDQEHPRLKDAEPETEMATGMQPYYKVQEYEVP